MNIKFFIVAWILFATISNTLGQTLSGKVIDQENQQPIIGAVVKINSTIGALTDENGEFIIQETNLSFPLELSISSVGYKGVKKELSAPSNSLIIQLISDGQLEEVVVESKRKATEINELNAQQTEVLGSKELLKAACCNLSESFENNATVDVAYADAVSGSKQISMLGLAGIYSQINYENMPLVRGLGEFYGLGFMPGTWVDAIRIRKGSGSVINGFESMTGQIDVQLHFPDEPQKIILNGYQNMQGRSEFNFFGNKHLNEQLSTGLFLHGNLHSGKQDRNDDNFLDNTLGGQFNILNRWKYKSKGNLRAQFGINYVHDEKFGGQVGYQKGDRSNRLYGLDIETDKVQFFTKTGLLFPEKPYKSIGLITNVNLHQQDAFFGPQALESKQKSLYSNFIYQTIIGDTRHKIKTGANLQIDDFDEQFNTTSNRRNYTVPGVFVEYAYDNLKQVKIVAGLRADYLSSAKAMEVSPRVHFKYLTDGDNSIRLSLGRGFRTPNLYADSPNLLANTRQVIIAQRPEIESSWNYGASLTRYYKFNGREGTFTADFFHTNFKNQIIRDTYTSPYQTIISNLKGTSRANSFQIGTDYELANNLDIRLAYKRDDVKQTIQNQFLEKAFVPKDRALLNLAYATRFERWKFDATAHYTGKQRLASSILIPDALDNAAYSPDFTRINAQVATKIRDWEIYLGGENLTNYKQKTPILNAENPFGTGFDASQVWGPIQGMNTYIGFRVKFTNSEEEHND